MRFFQKFSKEFYEQTDGVPKGSLLALSQANTFFLEFLKQIETTY